MVTEQERQVIIDEEQLRLLPLGYWVSAGFWAFYSLFVVAYFGLFGLLFLSVPPSRSSGAPPRELAYFFLAWAVFGLLWCGGMVTAKVLAARWIGQRRRRVAAMVVAGLSCLEMPYGTLLGVLTFIALARPSVRALFEGTGSGIGQGVASVTEQAPQPDSAPGDVDSAVK